MLTRIIFQLCVCLALAAPAAGQGVFPSPSPSPSSRQRYTDSLHGFSILPPVGARVRRQTGATERVQFLILDPVTGQIRIRMSVLQGAEKNEEVTDLAAYGRALAAKLRKDQNFEIEADPGSLSTAAGKPALVFDGVAGGAEYGLFRRDVWVQTGPRRFLVIRTSGPPDARAEIIALSRGCIDTLSVFDAEATRAKLESDLARGAVELERLTAAKLAGALSRREYWMAVLKDGGMVGFVHVTESPAAREGTKGFEIVTEAATRDGDQGRTLVRQEAYCSFDRTVAKWMLFSIDVEDQIETGRRHLFGLLQNDMLIVQRVIGPHQTQSKTRTLPHGVYAPMAMAPLLPRLIDRTRAGSYAFAQYNPSTEDLDMRTLTVVGAETVVLGGRKFPATLLTDQPAIGAPATKLYVDGAGLPLKIVRPDGSVLQQTTAEAIRSQFAIELNMLAPAP